MKMEAGRFADYRRAVPNAAQGGRFASALGWHTRRSRPGGILLTHAPDHPEIAEAAGVSLQLSGHTHLGSPSLELDRAADFYGSSCMASADREMQVFTSSGAGTVGARCGWIESEIVMLQFE